MMANKTALKNFLIMSIAAPVGSIFNFLMTIVIARSLQREGFGQYSQIISILNMFQIYIESSRMIFIRDISRDTGQLQGLFAIAKTMLWLVSGIGLITLQIAAWIIPGLQGLSQITIIFAAIGMIGIFHAIGFGIIFIATERMEFNAMGSVSHKLLGFILVCAVLWLSSSIEMVFAAIAISNLILWAFYHGVYRKWYGKVTVSTQIKQLWIMLRKIVVFGATAIARRLSWNLDIFLLSGLFSAGIVGTYNGALSMLVSLNMIPWIGTVAFFPMISRMGRDNKYKLIMQTWKVILLFMVVSIPAIFLGWLYTDKWIIFILGKEYTETVRLMKILIWDVLFTFPISMLFYIFSGLGHQKDYLAGSMAALAIAASLYMVFINQFGFSGIALGRVLADGIFFMLLTARLYILQRKYIDTVQPVFLPKPVLDERKAFTNEQ